MLLSFCLFACQQSQPPKSPDEPIKDVVVKKDGLQKEALEQIDKTTVVANTIYISEVMAFPSKVDKFRGEWIEIKNPTETDISLEGYSIHSANDKGISFDNNTVVSANGYLLVAMRKSPKGNGGLPKIDVLYKNSDLTITATDWLELRNGDSVIDRQEFAKGDLPTGRSLQIMANKSTCAAATPYGDGDLGTPKKPNNCG